MNDLQNIIDRKGNKPQQKKDIGSYRHSLSLPVSVCVRSPKNLGSRLPCELEIANLHIRHVIRLVFVSAYLTSLGISQTSVYPVFNFWETELR